MLPRRLSPRFVFTISVIAAVSLLTLGPAPAGSQSSTAAAPATPLILEWSDGERLVRRPGGPTTGWPFAIKVDGQNGNAQDFFVLTEVMAPGQTIPFHKHHNAEEILILEEGGATVTVGDKRAVTGPHAVVFIPRDTWVSVTNTGAQSIHLYGIFSRQGFERYLRAISVADGQAAPPLSPEDLPRLRATGHATYWDTAKGPYPPGVPRP